MCGSSCTSVTTKQLPGPSMPFSALLKACFDTDSNRTTEGGMSLPPTPPNYTAKSFLYQNNPWHLTNGFCQPCCTILCILIVTWLANAGVRPMSLPTWSLAAPWEPWVTWCPWAIPAQNSLPPPPPCRGSGAAHPKPACKLLYSRRTIDLCVLQPRCFDKAKPQIWKLT